MEWSMAPSSIVLVKQLLLCGGDGNSDWRERQGRRERQGQVSFPPLLSGGNGGGSWQERQGRVSFPPLSSGGTGGGAVVARDRMLVVGR